MSEEPNTDYYILQNLELILENILFRNYRDVSDIFRKLYNMSSGTKNRRDIDDKNTGINYFASEEAFNHWISLTTLLKENKVTVATFPDFFTNNPDLFKKMIELLWEMHNEEIIAQGIVKKYKIKDFKRNYITWLITE